MAPRQSDERERSESHSQRPALDAVRRKLIALQIDGPAPRPRMARWGLILGFLVAISALLFAFGPDRLSAWRGRARVTVDTVRPRVETVSANPAGAPLLTASGYVVARRQAVISAKIQGVLTELNVDVGESVSEGQVIARLKSAEFEARIANSKAAILVAQAALDESRRQLRIAEDLRQAQVLSQDQKDAAQSRFDSAHASLLMAQADLHTQETLKEDTVIRAPFSGTVVKKMAEIGESVSPIPPGVNISISSGAIVALADLSHLEVEVDVSESNIAPLQAGMLTEVVVQAFPDRKYRGTLRQLVPTADRTKGTVQAKVTILDPDRNMKPEMTARVTFLYRAVATGTRTTAGRVLSIPRQAVVNRADTSVIFEVVDETVHERTVTVSEQRGNAVMISRGLTGQEAIVLSPASGMREGDKVRANRTRGAE